MVTYHGATVKLVIERLLAEGKIQKEYIGTLNGLGVDQVFYAHNFPITGGAGEPGGVTGAVVANAPTETVFKTNLLSTVEDYYKDMTLRFTDGDLVGELSIITAYAQATKQITVASGFSVAPTVDDAFIIEPSVDVFTDDGIPDGSPTEYLEDGTDYFINGLTGKVTILAAENQGDNEGERISISYYTTAEVGEGQNASVDFDGGLEETHKLGSRLPREIKEGPITISGSIGQLFCDQHLFGKFLGESDFYKKLAEFSFYIYLDAPEGVIQTDSPYIKVAKTKFGGGSLTVDLGAIAALDVTFKGLAISTGTYTP